MLHGYQKWQVGVCEIGRDRRLCCYTFCCLSCRRAKTLSKLGWGTPCQIWLFALAWWLLCGGFFAAAVWAARSGLIAVGLLCDFVAIGMLVATDVFDVHARREIRRRARIAGDVGTDCAVYRECFCCAAYQEAFEVDHNPAFQ